MEVIGQQQIAYLDSVWLPDSKLLHVNNLSCVAIQPKGAISTVSMLCSELCQGPDHIGSAILCESAGNDLQSRSNCSIRVLLYTLHLQAAKQAAATADGTGHSCSSKLLVKACYLLPLLMSSSTVPQLVMLLKYGSVVYTLINLLALLLI